TAGRWVRAADLVDLDQVVRRDHARVDRIELPTNLLLLAPFVECVDPLRDDQEGTVEHLRHEIAQRNPDRTRQPHRLALTRNRSEMTVGRPQRLDVTCADRIFPLQQRNSRQSRLLRARKVYQPLNTL